MIQYRAPITDHAFATGKSQNEQGDALDAMEPRTGAHRTTRGVLRSMPREPLNAPWSNYVRVAGRKITITGARARYIWVYFTESPVRAEWSNADGGDPFPDGVEVYDTYVNEIHIPRIG